MAGKYSRLWYSPEEIATLEEQDRKRELDQLLADKNTYALGGADLEASLMKYADDPRAKTALALSQNRQLGTDLSTITGKLEDADRQEKLHDTLSQITIPDKIPTSTPSAVAPYEAGAQSPVDLPAYSAPDFKGLRERIPYEAAAAFAKSGNAAEAARLIGLGEGAGNGSDKTPRALGIWMRQNATQEDRDRVTATIDAMEKTGKYKPEDILKLRGYAQQNPLGAEELITGQGLRVGEMIRGKEEAIPVNAENAAATGAAGTRAREMTKRGIQQENPILSSAQSGDLTDSYMGVRYLNRLRSALEKNNIDFFDIDKRTGQFKNPEAADAYGQLVEIVGRKRSGAAISESEWGNFGKQILNKNFLLTKNGKAQALKQINDYLDRFYAGGVNVAGNEDWYNQYESRAKAARAKAQPDTPTVDGKFDELWNKYGGK